MKGLLSVALLLVSVQSAMAQDWPQWRGANRDGHIAAFREPASWPDRLTSKWKVDVGIGYATPLLVGNRLYLFTRQNETEVMSCLDAETGKVLWQTGYAAPFTISPAAARHGQGPKSTPTFAQGKLFTLGMGGVVTAFDAANGKQLWQKPAPDGVPPLYGTAMSPLVDGNLVIVHVGGHNHGALTAFDVNSGEVKWSWTGDGPGYASPIVATFDGAKQVVTFTQDNLVAVSAVTGELLWQREFKTRSTQNTVTPIVYGQTLIISGLEKGITAITPRRQDGKWVAENAWDNQEMSLYMSNAVLSRDIIFGLSNRNSGQYFAIDARTGQTLWKSEPRQGTNAAIVGTDTLLFILEDDGELIVARTNPQNMEILRRFTVADSSTWAQPVVSGNRVFIKDNSTVALWTLN
jgi:outer membrane protein assembly factor BamB